MSLLLCLLLAAGPQQAPEPPEPVVQGLVRDAAGDPLAGARVTLHGGASAASVLTDDAGRFRLPWPSATPARLTVEAAGHARLLRTVRVDDAPLELRLWPGGFAEEVTVTASLRREPVADTASAVTVLTSGELEATAAGAVDDAVRQAPGFTLFRRSGSRTANPTTQGATLRGLGGSGASRAAVLDDGLPLNDPFGGWVQWTRVPLQALDRIEVLRGGASSLYGTGALAGVIQLVRRADTERRLDVTASRGGLDTSQLTAFAGGSWNDWSARLSADAFDTGGYVAVREQDRGPVDTPFASQHVTADLTLERRAGASGRAFARGAFFDEDRRNGTLLQTNDTRLWQGALGLDQALFGGSLVARAHAGHQVYHQTFSAIDEARAREQLIRTQRVPSEAGGVAVTWTRVGGAHVVLAGADARAVSGTSEEEAVTPAGRTPSAAGGRQRSLAVFAEDVWSPAARWRISLGARWDGWRNDRARQATVMGTRALPSRGESALSPRLTVRHQAAPWVALTGSGYGAFRAPTLNELHRSFRVGNVVTLADPTLRAERLKGADLGALAAGRAVSVRATLFWMEVTDTIANVTLTATPTLVTRQRRNLGRIRSRGAELEVEARPGGRWVLSGTAAVTGATVRAFAADPALEGLRLPQVPRQSGSLQARYEGRRLRFSAQARWSGRQFEDDLNRLPLASFATVDVLASWAPRPQWEAFVAVENALDAEQEIGRTPVVTLAAPRAVRAGVRLRLRANAAGTSVALQ
jgi:outer membrane receptor protein involved in Fe transport